MRFIAVDRDAIMGGPFLSVTIETSAGLLRRQLAAYGGWRLAHPWLPAVTRPLSQAG
jgi:hypothetical protein